MYSLIALFFCLPLYFSHIFSPFGTIIWETSSFERQKVYLLILLVLMCVMEILYRNGGGLCIQMKKYWKYIMWICIFPLFVSFWWWYTLDDHFFFWSREKHHGYIWYIVLILLWILLSTLNSREKKMLVYVSMASSFLVASFALLEYISWGSLFFSQSGTFSWGSARSVSTLWNPNYVAGYLLMNIVCLSSMRSPERWIYALVVSLGIIATWSYIGIALLILYVLYRILRNVFPIEQSILSTLGVGILGWGIAYFFLSPDKLLSFQSRFVLMDELWTNMVQYPFAFLFWFGPESIISYFSWERTSLVNSYFPSTSAIDSSHNIFLDFLFQYGIFPLIFLWHILSRIWKSLQAQSQEWIILGCIFLSFNVTITAHVIMLILLGLTTVPSSERKDH